MKLPKERIIFSNYDPWEIYSDEDLKEIALECEWIDEGDEITQGMLEQWRNEEMDDWWENEKANLIDYFGSETVGFFGDVGLWHGIYKAGQIGDFYDLFCKAITDCWYWKFYDVDGHLYLTCSHHDGTNHFEIKQLTKKGREYLNNWLYGDDGRTEMHVHTQIFKKYSKLPRFAQNVYGCKARETEEVDKGGIIDRLNNEARSNYC